MLTSRTEVSEVHCVKDAKVPLMQFKLDGISFDLPYAQLKVMSVPEMSVMHVEPTLSKQMVPTCFQIYTRISSCWKLVFQQSRYINSLHYLFFFFLWRFDLPCYDLQNVDILNPFFRSNIDEKSWRSLSRVHANKCILRLLLNMEISSMLSMGSYGGAFRVLVDLIYSRIVLFQAFKSLLRCVKLWAKRRGLHPNVRLNGLISNFFKTFASWDWRTPVILQDGMVPMTITSDQDELGKWVGWVKSAVHDLLVKPLPCPFITFTKPFPQLASVDMPRSTTPEQRQRPLMKTLFRCGRFELRVTKIMTPSISCGRFDLLCTKSREAGRPPTFDEERDIQSAFFGVGINSNTDSIPVGDDIDGDDDPKVGGSSSNDGGQKGAHLDLALDTWTATNLVKKEFYMRQNKMVEASQAEKKQYAIDACMDCLATIDGITLDQYVKACNSFRNKATRRIFMKMVPNMKMHWVRKLA
ncbi:Nuclear poly(A) polymerase 3 [Camellia lanceoleosa]|uniref:Nuclear poly(A) polymerase 3 n=1 Tax=Camellia lanceoleosa TaxID=1840588 RepID=A0ACC0GTS1_9ERIC|nr:Nuclear poly(A) polymerase 3 [Camellia lanceoleosa]